MCTLIALHRCLPGAPLVVGANRDEYLDRPSEAPALRPTPQGTVLAPLDRRAGGTWLGLNARGLFAAVTNRRCPQPDPARRSRGLVVMDALSEASAERAAERIAALPVRAYNPFNLLVADARHAFAAVYEDRPRVFALAPGPHVVANADPDACDVPKVARSLARAERALGARPKDALELLAAACREHEGGSPLDDTCVHTPLYGTRSSTLLALADDPAQSCLRHASGPPCTAAYEDLTPLLGALLARGAVASETRANPHETRTSR
jgi:uncharacterized protein with NRDE domain